MREKEIPTNDKSTLRVAMTERIEAVDNPRWVQGRTYAYDTHLKGITGVYRKHTDYVEKPYS